MQHLKLLYSFSETLKQSIINVWTDIIKGKQPLFSYWLGIKIVSLGFFSSLFKDFRETLY